MLKELRIQNFKGWKDTGSIRMAPITLLFGTNSSGKSSIGQFLMMLKQTVENSDRKAIFSPGGKNAAVQLGSYKDMVFQHDLTKTISFEYQWSPHVLGGWKDTISKNSYKYDMLEFCAAVGLENPTEHTLSVEKFQYAFIENSLQTLSVGMTRNAESNNNYVLNSAKIDLKRNTGKVWELGSPVRFYGFPEEVVAYHQNASFVQFLNLIHEKFFQSLYYLGPLRTKTERLYSWSGTAPESVGYIGENTVSAILAAKTRQLNIVKLGAQRDSPAKPFAEVIANKLQEMGLIEDFQVNTISEGRHEYEVKVRTSGGMEWVDLPDVGFGISQVLPVLVQCFYAPAHSIIIMEQPEIHLHPSAQAALADVFIEAVNAREGGNARNIQLIIETHSEHFLRRLQRRIAEGVISKERVAAYFANVNTVPAQLEPLQMDDYGNILNWPENFFGDEMADIVGQATAAMKRKSEQKSSKNEGAL